MTFAIRSDRAGTQAFLNEVRQAVWSVNSNLPLASVRTMQEVYDKSVARTSFTLVMLGIAGAMAMALGMIGIYGVISYTVSQRRREIGIRLALGAQRGDVLQMVLRQGAKTALVGVAIGIAAALGLTELMSEPAVWRVGAGSPDVCRRCCPAHVSCTLGLLHSCAPRDAGRPGSCAALRIIALLCIHYSLVIEANLLYRLRKPTIGSDTDACFPIADERRAGIFGEQHPVSNRLTVSKGFDSPLWRDRA